MACEYFGPVDLEDSDAGETIKKWSDTCLADKKHPKAKLVRTTVLALYCCDKATDQIASTQREPRGGGLDYALTLPARELAELIEGREAALRFGKGRLLLRYVR
jgi:hypothetical protein